MILAVTALTFGQSTPTNKIAILDYTGQSFTNQDFIETVSDLDMKMVYVEGGEFLMGPTPEQGLDENRWGGIRRVSLDSYYIGEGEITQEQWTKIMRTSIQQQTSKAEIKGDAGSVPCCAMYNVNWMEAMAFCKELSRMTGRTYCLPTEAQWEYAARGGKKADGTPYSGSWSIDRVAWYRDNVLGGIGLVHRSFLKGANSLGLYDMTGNVSEWCSDWYNVRYDKNDTINPAGPSTGSERVVRGGSWCDNSIISKVSYRQSAKPDCRDVTIGFRVVMIP